MKRVIVPAFGASIFLLIGHGTAAEPRPPIRLNNPSGFESPSDAWTAASRADQVRDWAAAFDCRTPAAQDDATSKCLLQLITVGDLSGPERGFANANSDVQKLIKRRDGFFR